MSSIEYYKEKAKGFNPRTITIYSDITLHDKFPVFHHKSKWRCRKHNLTWMEWKETIKNYFKEYSQSNYSNFYNWYYNNGMGSNHYKCRPVCPTHKTIICMNDCEYIYDKVNQVWEKIE